MRNDYIYKNILSMRFYCIFFLIFIITNTIAQIPNTDIFKISIIKKGKNWIMSDTVINCTQRIGYDNQPGITDTGFLYSSIKDSLQSEIWYYDFGSCDKKQITNTDEAEYSPRYTNRNTISCVRVERDGITQNFYDYNKDGTPKQLLVGNQDTVGYYQELPNNRVAFFLLNAGKSDLYIYDLQSHNKKLVSNNIGRCMSFHNGKLYFVDKSRNDNWFICTYDIHHGYITKVVPTVMNSEDFIFIDAKTIVMGQKSALYYYNMKKPYTPWNLLKDYNTQGIQNIKRLAYSNGNFLLCADDAP